MTDLLNRKNRGNTWDRSFPEAAIRALRQPHVAPNPYIGHRITLDAGCGLLGCDCGSTFDTATELEFHQQRYRNPR